MVFLHINLYMCKAFRHPHNKSHELSIAHLNTSAADQEQWQQIIGTTPLLTMQITTVPGVRGSSVSM